MEDRPAENTIRWNPSSNRHRNITEALSTDPSKENVGNIYFSRTDDYIISPRRSPRVYVGFSDEYTEVAVREIETGRTDHNAEDVRNLLQRVRVLESKNIMKYVGLEQDGGFYYLAAELCECDLEGYMTNSLDPVMKAKAVTDILRGLQALHSAGVIHDSHSTAKLADYGSIYELKRSSTADAQSWEATEISNEAHTKSSDIQVAGMLVYYILSGGEHPFGNINDREENIKNGTYSLEHVQDTVAKDLIEWMINKEPKNRPTIDDVLQHPYFWDNSRKDVVLRRLGDREEVQEYKTYYNPYKKIVEHSIYYTRLYYVVEHPSFTTPNISYWKSKMSFIWGNVDENLPDDLLGLLRFLRNKLVHENGNFTHISSDNFLMNTVREVFPKFFTRLHRLAYKMEWEY